MLNGRGYSRPKNSSYRGKRLGNREHAAQEQQLQREHEIQLAQLKIQSPPPPVHLSKRLPLPPQFLDEDPDTFFRQFESRAVNLNIDRNQRALLL